MTKKQTWWLIIGAVVIYYLFFRKEVEVVPEVTGAGGGAEGTTPIRNVGNRRCRGACKIRPGGAFSRKYIVPCIPKGKGCVCQGSDYTC